jgi:hypothetical protein
MNTRTTLLTSALTAKILAFCTITSLTFISGQVEAKDAFGLDAFKNDASKITETKTPYKTRFGNPMTVYSIPETIEVPGKAPVRFLVQGGLHGNELLTSDFVAWLAQRFAKGTSPLNKINNGRVAIDFIPYANPDGTLLYARYNGNHINLNRNFGVLWGLTKENPGKSPFSEVESRAIKDLIQKRNYAGAVDVHGYINWIVLPSSPSDPVRGLPTKDEEKVKRYKQWSAAIHREVKKSLPGYEVKTAGGLGDGGAFEDYAWWGSGVPAFCLEAFSEQRFVATNIATQIVDLITPNIFSSTKQTNGRNDMFLVYEMFIKNMFDEALRLGEINAQFTASNP